MRYEILMGRGGRPATGAWRAPIPWRPSLARDYDPAYYQAFYAPIGDELVNARVYAKLGGDDFTVSVHGSDGWTTVAAHDGSCSCQLLECEHLKLLKIAQSQGLILHRRIEASDFLVFPQAHYIELRAARLWPPEVGPNFAHVYLGPEHCTVRLHETGGHELYTITARACSCGRKPACAHRDLVHLAAQARR